MPEDHRNLPDQPGRSEVPERNEDLGRALGQEPWRSRDIVRIERVTGGWLIYFVG
jgi:hypothetical protein